MQARLTLLTVVVVAMAALLALHIAEPCNQIWPDVGNCVVEQLRGEEGGVATETSSQESTDPSVEGGTAAQESENDSAPEGEASGENHVSCGTSICFEEATPVYPITGGDVCVQGGEFGTWQSEPQYATAQLINCEPASASTEDVAELDPMKPVACLNDGRQNFNLGEKETLEVCRQGSVPVLGPEAGEQCGEGTYGTWTRVETLSPSEGTFWRCLGD